MRWAVLDGVCTCVCVTHVVYSRGPSSPGYTCTPRHRHCSRPRCDSYMCGYSWAPTDQGDKLKDKDNNHSMSLGTMLQYTKRCLQNTLYRVGNESSKTSGFTSSLCSN